MTREEVIAALQALPPSDAYDHERAEDLIMTFLRAQGYGDVVEAWYATKQRLWFWYE